jgi:hypothetical protein
MCNPGANPDGDGGGEAYPKRRKQPVNKNAARERNSHGWVNDSVFLKNLDTASYR